MDHLFHGSFILRFPGKRGGLEQPSVLLAYAKMAYIDVACSAILHGESEHMLTWEGKSETKGRCEHQYNHIQVW